MDQIINKINFLCAQKGISIPELALKIGMSKAGLYEMLKANRLRVDTLYKISTVFEVQISYFFDGRVSDEKLKDEIEAKNLKIKELESIIKDKSELLKFLRNENEDLKNYIPEASLESIEIKKIFIKVMRSIEKMYPDIENNWDRAKKSTPIKNEEGIFSFSKETKMLMQEIQGLYEMKMYKALSKNKRFQELALKPEHANDPFISMYLTKLAPEKDI